MIERPVYLELVRRGYRIYIGKSGDKEIDFVAEKSRGVIYFQVAYIVRDEKTLKRELSALESINNHYQKYILTMDIDPEVDYNDIRKINVLVNKIVSKLNAYSSQCDIIA